MKNINLVEAYKSILLKAATEPNVLITIVGKTVPMLRQGAIQDIANILQNNLLVNTKELNFNKGRLQYFFKNGSVLEFKSYENKEDARSGMRQYALFIAVNTLSEGIYEEIALRTSHAIYLNFSPALPYSVDTKLLKNFTSPKLVII